MKISHTFLAFVLATGATACGQSGDQPDEATEPTNAVEEQSVTDESGNDFEVIEVTPGLSAKILQRGYGRAAEAGDHVDVHYTGWLYDEQADDNRGQKFDSSVDRGQTFQFTLGAGQVIKGWDQGVAGMLIGEKRELKLSPEMGYGDRGAGNVIRPGAALVFEVELFGLEGPSDSR